MENIKKTINTILTADKEHARIATGKVRKLVYASNKANIKEITSAITEAPATYSKITDPVRQEYFVRAISVMYFLHDKEDTPDFLFPWLFELLQHSNGNIRQSAVRMIGFEFGSLTFHIRFPGEKRVFSNLSAEYADRVLHTLRLNLESISQQTYKPAYKRFKYIDSLPSSVHKSVQYLLCDLDDMCTASSALDEEDLSDEIIEMRKEIEQKVCTILKQNGSKKTFEDVLDIIFYEEGSSDFGKMVALFGNKIDDKELNDIVKILTDAWNYFPHKSLHGLSPVEVISNT